MDFAYTLDSSGSSQSNSRSKSSETRCQKARSTDNYLSGKDDNRIQFNHHAVESLRNNFQINQALEATVGKRGQKDGKQFSLARRILIIDDDPDITFTFKKCLEMQNQDDYKTKKYEVQVYNDPIFALSEFKRDFYDLLLVDINMPRMNGFEFAKAVLALDVNVKLCFMSSGHINQEALRELYPAVGIGCFIIKPVTLDDLIKRVDREVD
jgi:CheY-like chemotaxis protein